MSIERKCKNCQFDSEGLNEICAECLMCNKGASHIVFTPKEELIRRDEKKHWQEVRDKEVKEAFRKGMTQAYFDIAMELEKDIPILEWNYKSERFGFQKGFWQGNLEYARMLKDYCFDKQSNIDKKEK